MARGRERDATASRGAGSLGGFVACGHDPPLPERARADNVTGRHEAMYRAGELVLLGNRVVPVGPLLAEAVRRYGVPQAIAADRWRAGEADLGGPRLARWGAGRETVSGRGPSRYQGGAI